MLFSVKVYLEVHSLMSNNDFYISLDIGTSTVKVIIGEMLGDSLNIIGVGNVKSKGIRKGSIVDIDETVQSIKKAIEQAERMVGIKISSVIVGIGGNHIGLQQSHGVVAVSSSDREISNEDVHRVMDAAQVISVAPEREILSVVPKYFIVDGVDEISDPRGMIGVRLEMLGSIVTCSKTSLHNLARCVERAGLHVVDVVLNPLASSMIALTRDEKDLGVCLIDIGGGSTTVSIFDEGVLKNTVVIPIGGEHITKDLSLVIKTSSEEAERIKVKYGHAFYDTAMKDEVFDVTIIGNEQYQQFTQAEIADIIEARLEELFSLAMSGISDLAQAILRNRVRVVFPDYIGVRDPQYTNSVGMILHAYQTSKLLGRDLISSYVNEKTDKRQIQKNVSKQKAPQNGETMSEKFKKVLNYFWD
ncbi:MAG: cell division protein FtsA [Bacillales bacterium]|nr:cell division protein FtsA [Bacillales bacterium]